MGQEGRLQFICAKEAEQVTVSAPVLQHDKVLIIVPSRLLLEQFADVFPNFCKVGTRYNHQIQKRAPGFIAVSRSVHLLQNLKLGAIFVDEAHHPLPQGMPQGNDMYFFSATHHNATDFKYSMGQASEEGVLCDYDLTVPVISAGHAYTCLASLLLRNHGRFRRVLAYCNSVKEAKVVRLVFEKFGMAAWHINAATSRSERKAVLQDFSGDMRGLVHVLVTVEVLGEGVNIPNADTCMFVEPRQSFRAIVQAFGRVLRQHACKPLAHIILPAIPLCASANATADDASRAVLATPTSFINATNECHEASGEASNLSLTSGRGSGVDAHLASRNSQATDVTAGRLGSPASRPVEGMLGGSEVKPTLATSWHASLELPSPAASQKRHSNGHNSMQVHLHVGGREYEVEIAQKDEDFSYPPAAAAAAEGRLQLRGGMFCKSSLAPRKVLAMPAVGADKVVYESSSEAALGSS